MTFLLKYGCTNTLEIGKSPPSFVGNDYFCDTARKFTKKGCILIQ